MSVSSMQQAKAESLCMSNFLLIYDIHWAKLKYLHRNAIMASLSLTKWHKQTVCLDGLVGKQTSLAT